MRVPIINRDERTLWEAQCAALVHALRAAGDDVPGGKELDAQSEAWVRIRLWPPDGWATMEHLLAARVQVVLPDLRPLARGLVDHVHVPSLDVEYVGEAAGDGTPSASRDDAMRDLLLNTTSAAADDDLGVMLRMVQGLDKWARARGVR